MTAPDTDGGSPPATGSWTDVCSVDDVDVDDVVRVRNEPPVAVVNADGDFYAVRDICTHEDFPLSEGLVCDRRIECSFHGAAFDLVTGETDSLLAEGPVATYPTRVIDGRVHVLLPG